MKLLVSGDVLTSKPQTLDGVQSFAVFDDFGNPILAVKKLEQGTILTTKAGDKDFRSALEAFGVTLMPRVINGGKL